MLFEVKDRGLVDCLESYHYEVTARQQLLAFMVSSGYDLTGDAFIQYHKEYVEHTAQYEMAKGQFEADVVKPQMKGTAGFTWNLDFASGIVTVSGAVK